jgi:hypothetical protein
VDQFAFHLKDAISRPNAADPLPFQSLQLLVRSLGTEVTTIARDLVSAILSTPITKPAVVCLAHMAESITELHPQISSMLLDAISMVLQKKPFSETMTKEVGPSPRASSEQILWAGQATHLRSLFKLWENSILSGNRCSILFVNVW